MRKRSWLTPQGKRLMKTMFVLAVFGIAAVWCIRGLLAVAESKEFARLQKVRREQSNLEVIDPVGRDPVSMVWSGAREALTLLRMHESWDGRRMIGDRGRARGWLQQHESHWYEGCEMLGVDWSWPEGTDNLSKCEDVAIGYWMIYARKYLDEGDVEELIRRFRLPNNPYRDDNNEYLLRVLGEE